MNNKEEYLPDINEDENRTLPKSQSAALLRNQQDSTKKIRLPSQLEFDKSKQEQNFFSNRISQMGKSKQVNI